MNSVGSRTPSNSKVRRLVAIGAAVFTAGGVATALLFAQNFDRHNRSVQSTLASASLCSKLLFLTEPAQSSPLFSTQGGNMEVASLGKVSTVDAAHAAVDMQRAHLSAHPWDQEPPHTRVAQCHMGGRVWYVDQNGHATRIPAS